MLLLCPLHPPSYPPPAENEAYDISLAKLNSLLEARTKFYENADVVIDLKGYGKDEAAGAPTSGVLHYTNCVCELTQALHRIMLMICVSACTVL